MKKEHMKEGVGNYSVVKTGEKTEGDGTWDDPSVTSTYYDVMKDGQRIGELEREDYFGHIRGHLFGKMLPDLSGYGQNKRSGPLSSLHSFLKSKTGKKWLGILKENTMKKSELKTLIKEVVGTINELTGEQPEIGQFKWNYEIKIVVQQKDVPPYEATHVSKWAPIVAKDEVEAKAKAIAPYNPKVVTIKSVRMIKDRPITQADIDQYHQSVAGYAHEMRPKNQGGWGANESINEASKGNYIQVLKKVKSLIDQSSQKNSLKALIKKYDGEPMLELRAYGLPMGDNHGFVELQDEFGSIVESLTNDHWEVVEIDEAEVGGKQFKYALFTFPQSGKMPGDDSNVGGLIDMGRESVSVNELTGEHFETQSGGQINDAIVTTPSKLIKDFAKEVADKMKWRMMKQGQMGYNDIEALRQMIESKLAKEGWNKGEQETRLHHRGYSYSPTTPEDNAAYGGV